MTLAGLSDEEARDRFAADGPNELPRGQRRTVWRIAGEVLREPMLGLLLVAGLAYLLLGDTTEALILLGFATLSIVITTAQEARTEHILEALRDLSAPRALVMRNGRMQRIPGRQVVRGDILILEQGDRIASDAVVLEATDLEIDESLLTGESLPVAKAATGAESDYPALVYSGTLVTRGSGVAQTLATGSATEIGKIGESLARVEVEPSRLRQETGRIVQLCAVGGIAVALLVVLLYGLLRGSWLDAVLAGIAIGMSMLPEEFPMVLTIFLAMGAWRIGQARVLARRSAAIETLGSATVLCTDKTGTLTENRMAVAELWSPSSEFFHLGADQLVPAGFRLLLQTAFLASPAMPSDPMDVALVEAGRSLDEVASAGAGLLVRAHGLQPDLLATTNVWRKDHDGLLVVTKGAPETISTLCHLSPDAHRTLMAAVEAMAARGIRVLGLATAHHQGNAPAVSPREYHFSLVGLVGLADPLRAGVPAAVKECQAAGIRVVMITGDHATTARSIASQAGITDGDILTGAELAALDDDVLAARLDHITVFARILPQQKLRIVEALKARGEVVAMTGDGVNDAPSLKAADIGVAMGGRGTDVAREAAAIVLLDDDFGSVVRAVRLGRRIYDNIHKATGFIFAVHVPIAGLAILPFVVGLPVLFGPIHIALIEMIIDPVCALVFEAEPEESDVMSRQPRPADERLFGWRSIGRSVSQGGMAFAMSGTAFVLTSRAGVAENEVRAITFFALIAAILALIFANRSFGRSIMGAFHRSNMMLRYVLIGVAALVVTILLVPGLRAILKFDPIHLKDFTLILGATAALLMGLEQVKTLKSSH